MITDPLHVRLTRSLAAALLVAALAVVAWPAAPATAESPDSAGWWNRARPVLPSDAGDGFVDPYGTPNGGIAVANAPDGPAAIGALRFAATRARKATLTLKAPEGETISDQAMLVACPVSGEWDGASNGPWDERPEVICETVAVPGEVSADRGEVRFAINEEFFRLGVLVNSIEIGVASAPGHQIPFEQTFQRPSGDALVASSPLVEPPQFGNGNEGGGPPETFAPPATQPPSNDSSPPPTFGGFESPGDTVFEAPPPVDNAGNVSVDDPVFTNTTVPGEVAAPVPVSSSSSDRLLAAAVLALMAGSLFMATTQQPREPKLIGGLAARGGAAPATATATGQDPPQGGPGEGGVGRFRRLRDKLPTG